MMTVEEARKLYETYKWEISCENDHTHEDALTEVTKFLAEETNDPWYVGDLGAYYYGVKQYDLARKYYELAYELGDHEIAVCLGYIWYYGRTGTVDYEKAFHYYSEAAESGNQEARRKIADMYKNGYYVEKDYQKYCQIIEELYEEYKDDEYPFLSLPDILTRLAGIRKKEGNIQEAVLCYRKAKELLPVRMGYTEFFGDINVMNWLVNDLYSLVEPDYADLDIFDLFYILKKPSCVTFYFQERQYEIRSEIENEEYSVQFDGGWYRSVNDLFQKALLKGKPFYVRHREIYHLEVSRDGY